MNAKKNKKTEEKPAKYKRISMICGVVGIAVAFVSVIFWIISGLTQEECVFVEVFVGERTVMMCEYETGNVVSDAFYKISIPTFWRAGGLFPYDTQTNERVLSD